jgi:hypothetical protein
MGEGFIVRRGGGGQQTVKPIYNSLTSVDFTSLTLNVTNDSNSIATLYYSVVEPEPGPTTPDTFDTEFAGKETKDITITDLTEGTTYTVYLKAIAVGEFPSETVIVPGLLTATIAPTINFVSTTDSSITFTLTNNSSLTKDITYGLTTPPTTTTIGLSSNTTSANQIISGLNAEQQYTIFAQAQNSNIEALTVTTNKAPVTLYQNGNEFSGTSGGWAQGYRGSSIAFTNKTSSFLQTGYNTGSGGDLVTGASMRHLTPINFTGFSTLRIEFDHTATNQTNNRVNFLVVSSPFDWSSYGPNNNVSLEQPAATGFTGNQSRQFTNIDISNLEGNHNIGFRTNRGTFNSGESGNAKVYLVQLL